MQIREDKLYKLHDKLSRYLAKEIDSEEYSEEEIMAVLWSLAYAASIIAKHYDLESEAKAAGIVGVALAEKIAKKAIDEWEAQRRAA